MYFLSKNKSKTKIYAIYARLLAFEGDRTNCPCLRTSSVSFSICGIVSTTNSRVEHRFKYEHDDGFVVSPGIFSMILWASFEEGVACDVSISLGNLIER